MASGCAATRDSRRPGGGYNKADALLPTTTKLRRHKSSLPALRPQPNKASSLIPRRAKTPVATEIRCSPQPDHPPRGDRPTSRKDRCANTVLSGSTKLHTGQEDTVSNTCQFHPRNCVPKEKEGLETSDSGIAIDLGERYHQTESCPNMEEVMNGFLGSHPVTNGFPSTCPVDEKSLASLLVDNALLRAQLVLLREGRESSPLAPLSSSASESPYKDGVLSSRISSPSVTSRSPSSSVHSYSSNSYQSLDGSAVLVASPSPHSPPLPHTSARVRRASTQSQYTQTTPIYSSDREPVSMHMQQKLEAVTISNELLTTSLEDARKQVSSLEATIATQRKELASKESQIAAISNRITTLLRNFETSQTDILQYRDLYHRSVQQCTALHLKIEQFNTLFSKMDTVVHLKNTAYTHLTANKQLLQHWTEDLTNREKVWREKLKQLDELKAENEKQSEDCRELRNRNSSLDLTCQGLQVNLGRHLARSSVARAAQTLGEEAAVEMRRKLKAQKDEITRLQESTAHLLSNIERSQAEFQETTEFSEAERQLLIEANTDLEEQIAQLRSDLEKERKMLSREREEHREALSRQQMQPKEEYDSGEWQVSPRQANEFRTRVKEIYSVLGQALASLDNSTDQPESQSGTSSPVNQLQELMSQLIGLNTERCDEGSDGQASCSKCAVMRERLEASFRALNEKGTLRYGDLMREKFSLEEQVRELNCELEKGEKEFQKLAKYIKEYQEKSSVKTEGLKSHLSKAGNEISELDKLVEHIRQVLRDNHHSIDNCQPLLDLLAELDGTDEALDDD